MLEAPPVAEPDGWDADEHATGVPANVIVATVVNGMVKRERCIGFNRPTASARIEGG